MKGTLVLRVVALSFAWAVGACVPQRPDRPTFDVADSAGIEIVTSHSPQGFETPLALTADPILRIGKGRDEEPYLFGSIGGATRLEDGSLVVLDRGSEEIRCFDSEGQHVWTVGGKGEGPGEFRNAMWLQRRADTVLVFDLDGTVARFDPAGRLLSETPTGGLLAGDWSVPGEWRGVLADGVLFGVRYTQPQERPTGTVFRPPSVIVLSDHARTETTPVVEVPGSAGFQDSGGYRGGFFPQYLTDIRPSLEPVGLLVGDNETFTIDLFDSRGTHLRRVRYPAGVPEADPQRIDAERRKALAGFEAAAERRPSLPLPGFRRWLEDLPRPRVWPGFGFLIGSEDGHVWAMEYRTEDMVGYARVDQPEAPRGALVFHPHGHLLGRVELPSRLIPWEIGTDYVLGVERDQLDVSEVVLYGLAGG